MKKTQLTFWLASLLSIAGVQAQESHLSGVHQFYIGQYLTYDPALAGIRNNSGNPSFNAKNGGGIYINRDVTASTIIQSKVNGTPTTITSFDNSNVDFFPVGGTPKFRITSEGKLGVNVTTPVSDLHIYRDGAIDGFPTIRLEHKHGISTFNTYYNFEMMGGTGTLVFRYNSANVKHNSSSATGMFEMYPGGFNVFGLNNTSLLSFGAFNSNEGGLKIHYGDLLLGQNFKVKNDGYLYARRVEVMAGNFPDYVFDGDYKLRTLEEVEEYIQTNHHLPEVPSAEEVKENGHDLGAMDEILLKKIEELTLYMIDLKKENDLLKERLLSLEGAVSDQTSGR